MLARQVHTCHGACVTARDSLWESVFLTACELQGSHSGHGSWQQTPLLVGTIPTVFASHSFFSFYCAVFDVPLISVCLHFEQGHAPQPASFETSISDESDERTPLKLTLAFDELSVIMIPVSSRKLSCATADLNGVLLEPECKARCLF